MNALSKHTVVTQMTTELAERRRTAATRRAAYLTLAQAILADENDAYLPSPDTYAAPLVQSLVAA